MSNYILDCCSLINLYCGWGGIQELSRLNKRFCIGEIALAEAKYAREYQADRMIPVDVSAVDLLAQYPFQVLRITDAAEQTNFVEFAKQIDDGEAEALAFAAARKLILVTDDRLAINVAARSNLNVKVIGTSDILIEWANSDQDRKARLPSIVKRISELARFCPHRSDQNFSWWKQLLE
jgi:predicted nucleic acid-binding protein